MSVNTLSQIESKLGTSMALMDLDQAVSVPLWSRNTKDLTKPEVARTDEYIASLKLSRGGAIWQVACCESNIDLEKATAIFDKATQDFWTNHPPVPKQTQKSHNTQHAQFGIDSDEESSSGEDSEDGFARDAPAEVKGSHRGEVVPESVIPVPTIQHGKEWEFVNPTKDSVIYTNLPDWV